MRLALPGLSLPRHALRAAVVAALAAVPFAAPAGATVISTRTMLVDYEVMGPGGALFSTANPTNFAATALGQVQVSTYVVGAYSDFGRNGAGFTASSGLVSGGLIQNGSPVAVTSAGGSASFAGAGGTGGTVQIGSLTFTNPNAVTTGSTANGSLVTLNELTGGPLLTSELRMTALDTGADGVFFASSASARVNGETELIVPGNASSLGRAATRANGGSTLADCSDTLSQSCDSLSSFMDIALSPKDIAAGLVRNEIGGDALEPGAQVAAIYALASDVQLFDCGAAGCTGQDFSVFFTPLDQVSLGDRFVFAVVQIVSTVDGPGGEQGVPEPATLALLGFGLAGLAAARGQRGGGRARRHPPV